jgi:hypothetical protein
VKCLHKKSQPMFSMCEAAVPAITGVGTLFLLGGGGRVETEHRDAIPHFNTSWLQEGRGADGSELSK